MSAVFVVFYFCISRQAQFPQPLHILDFGLVSSLILFQCIIDFGFSPFVPVENCFCDFALLCKKHKHPLVVTKCPTWIGRTLIWGYQTTLSSLKNSGNRAEHFIGVDGIRLAASRRIFGKKNRRSAGRKDTV
ncbi:MAG: hypothetical protein WAK67_23420, partial [Xanthobacteraceae bacterium]